MNFADLEAQFGLPSGLLSAVQSVESGGDPNAVSPKGAVGTFQFMPATAQQYGVDPTDPDSSAVGAAKMLADLGKKYGGDLSKMLAAYNWGQGNVDRKGLDNAPPETQQYIQKVSAKMDDPAMAWLRANAPAQSAPTDDPAMAWLRANAPAQANPDANLGGTLQIGPIDTGIKIPPSIESGLVGAGKTLTRLGQGVQQAFNAVTGGDNTGLNQQVAEENKLYQPLAAAHPIATSVGETLPYMATTNPLLMATMAGTEYGSPTDRAERAAMTYGGAKVAQGVGRLFGPRSMAPLPDNGAGEFFDYPASQGNPWNIPLRAAQTTDSMPVKIMDSVAANLPISSGVIAKAKDATYQGFNRAVGQTFGADTTQITPELLGDAQNTIGKTIGNIASRNSIGLDNDLFAGLKAAQARAAAELTPDEQAIVSKQIQNIWNSVDPETMTIPGTQYKAQQSALGNIAKNRGGTVANVLGDVRSTLRDAMTRSVSPDDSAAWLKANQQYFNLKQVADATKATPGAISPAQLLTQVNAAQKAARFGGGNDLADLAQWAKTNIPDAIPNSGTAQRVWYQKLMTNPLTTIGSLGGAAYGADKMGIDPQYAAEGLLLPYLAARGMAGKPASALAKQLLTGGGGLLGYELAPK